jgi:hypothetical protein
VVLGEPVARVAERLGMAGEGQRLLDRATRVEAADDGGLIENRELHGAASVSPKRAVVVFRRKNAFAINGD